MDYKKKSKKDVKVDFDAKKAVEKEINEINNFSESIISFDFEEYQTIKVPIIALLNSNKFNPEELKDLPFEDMTIKVREFGNHDLSVNDVDGLLHAVYIMNKSNVKEYIKEFITELGEPEDHKYGVVFSILCWLEYFELKDAKVYKNLMDEIVKISKKKNLKTLLMKLRNENFSNPKFRAVLEKL